MRCVLRVANGNTQCLYIPLLSNGKLCSICIPLVKKKKNYLAKAKASGKVDFSPTLNHGKNEDKRKYHE